MTANTPDENSIEAAKLPQSVSELVAGLYAVGGSFPVLPRLTWLPESARGWMTSQCYVLRDRGHVAIIDAGSGIVWDNVRPGLTALIDGATDRHLMLTRREPDSGGNTPQILQEFAINTAHSAGEQNALTFFALVDDVNAVAYFQTAASNANTEYRFLRPGNVFCIGSFEFEVIRPSIRVISAVWLYERTTRTLFCSDSWGLLLSEEKEWPKAVRPSDEILSPEHVAEFMGARFEWLNGIDVAPVEFALSNVMDKFEIDRLCPNFGFVIEGRDAVRKVVASTHAALKLLAKRPYINPMKGFNLDLMQTA